MRCVRDIPGVRKPEHGRSPTKVPWLLLAAIAAAGCGGYSAPDEVTFGSLVYSEAAPDADFAPLRTYYLDPVMEAWEDGAPQPSQPVPAATVDDIDMWMTEYGYTAVTNTPGPGATPDADVGMRLAFLESNQDYYVSSGYCSVYWAYYACWPGWAYAGSYATGTVLVLMVDTRVAPPTTSVLWAAALYAVLRGSTIENTSILNDALDRAFQQSTYLQTSAVGQ